MSVDHTLSVPPSGSSALKSGAVVGATSNAVSVCQSTASVCYFFGVTFANTGSGNSSLYFGAAVGSNVFLENCAISAGCTGGLQNVVFSSSGSLVTLKNTTYAVTTTTLSAGPINGPLIWKDTASAYSGVIANAAGRNGLFQPASGPTLIEGVDLSSSLFNGNNLVWSGGSVGGSTGGYLCFKNCKLNSGCTIGQLYGGGNPTVVIDLVRCDSGGTNYRNERYSQYGVMLSNVGVYRSGGASDGATPVSHQITTYTNSISWFAPFVAGQSRSGTRSPGRTGS